MDNSRIIDGKKYLWDGETYESESAAKEQSSKYNKDGFETKIKAENKAYYLFTRRVVTEIVVEDKPT